MGTGTPSKAASSPSTRPWASTRETCSSSAGRPRGPGGKPSP